MSRTTSPADPAAPGQVVSLRFHRFAGARRAWAFAQMGLARRPLARMPGVGFVKLMGAGTGEGFTPIPDTGAVVVLTTWPDLHAARRAHAEQAPLTRLAARAAEVCTIHLAPINAWGAWSGRMPFHATPAPAPGPVAALTRATIRPAALWKFWRHEPNISAAIGDNPDVLFKAGVGEVPWLHQVTFSIWPDTRSMAAFARADGPHARAIAAVRAGNWFAEELYARFAVLEASGAWRGRAVLSPLPHAAE